MFWNAQDGEDRFTVLSDVVFKLLIGKRVRDRGGLDALGQNQRPALAPSAMIRRLKAFHEAKQSLLIGIFCHLKDQPRLRPFDIEVVEPLLGILGKQNARAASKERRKAPHEA